MREILFRGKRKDNGEWAEGYFVHCKSDFDEESERTAEIIPHNADRIYKGEYCPLDVREVILETVGQFTGLTDKNGKKIFEGDILANINRNRREPKVFLQVTDIRNGQNLEAYVETLEFEVVGNIHDNPELLEG